MSLPIFQSNNKDFVMMQNKWKSALDPVLSNPTIQGFILKDVALASGTNTINHLLGRKLVGWNVVRQRGAAALYDEQDANQMQDLTLVLISSAAVSVDLMVF